MVVLVAAAVVTGMFDEFANGNVSAQRFANDFCGNCRNSAAQRMYWPPSPVELSSHNKNWAQQMEKRIAAALDIIIVDGDEDNLGEDKLGEENASSCCPSEESIAL